MAVHPYYWQSSLLLNMEGPPASTTFTDISPIVKSPSSVNGDAKITTTAGLFKTGAGALVLDGTGDWLDYAQHAGFDFGTGAFRIRLWWRPASVSTNQQLVGYNNAASSTDPDAGWAIRTTTTGKVNVSFYDSTNSLVRSLTGATTLVVGTWYQIEFARTASGAVSLRLNGTTDATTTTFPGNVNNPTSRILRIGRYDNVTNNFPGNGYIDGLEILKGTAGETGNYTPTFDLFEVSPPGTGTAAVTIPSPTIATYGGASAAASIPAPTISATAGGSAEVTIPFPQILAQGRDTTGERAANVVIPFPQIIALAGASAAVTIPFPVIQASMTVPVRMTASVVIPFPQIIARLTGTERMTASVVIPFPQIDAKGGGNAAVTVPVFTASASATVGATMQALVTIPFPQISASGTAGIVINAYVLIPMLQSAPNGRAFVVIPFPTIVARGSAVVAVTYEAYAVNLMPGESMPHQVTRYTNYGFDHIVRHQDSYYGFKSGGVYLLGGATDYAATPTAVPWDWKTAITGFGSRQKKQVREGFIHGRLGPNVTASVSIGEAADKTYAATIVRGSTAQAHRVKYGKGLKDEYWSFGFSGTGPTCDVDSMEHEPVELQRKL